MKKYKLILSFIAIAGLWTSCGNDYLTIYPTDVVVAGAPATSDVIQQNVTGAYQLMYFDDYANSQWMPVNMMFDVCTDDVFKGGSDASDQPFLLGIAEFRSTSSLGGNGWWSIFYAGLKRCNGALDAIANAVNKEDPILPRLKAEMLTLRAYYVHWLWKAYGNVPYFDKVWTEPPFGAKQYSFDELYPLIIADLDAAIAEPTFPMSDNKGFVNKSMAMMTKARVVMYKKDQSKYAEVLADMKTIINSGKFSLVTKAVTPNVTGFLDKDNTQAAPSTTNPIEWIFLRDGEFCSESIFEVNRTPNGRSWGNAWAGYGMYTPRFVGSRDIGIAPFVAGWGFCPVNATTFNAIFNEAGDYRKDASAILVTTKSLYQTGVTDATNGGLCYFLKKYIARQGYNVGTQGDRDLNYENNERIYRIAEAYLNAAELELAAGGGQGTAQPYLDAIRDRAFGDASHRIPATLNNIKLERHREFFGEGLRFWDLVRWGSDENDRPISQVLSVTDMNIPIQRVWDDTKKFLPIPQGDIDKTVGTEFPLVQNPGY